jgi:hypothetical protein
MMLLQAFTGGHFRALLQAMTGINDSQEIFPAKERRRVNFFGNGKQIHRSQARGKKP